MSKHTPGPWEVGPQHHGQVAVWQSDFPAVVATCGRQDDAEANARLIAAAPDLLAALKETLRASPMGPHVKMAQAAIAKAEQP